MPKTSNLPFLLNNRVQKLSAMFQSKKGLKISNQTHLTMSTLFDTLIRGGAQAIVLGCTELQAVVSGLNTSVPIVDSLEVLARAAIEEAGRPK